MRTIKSLITKYENRYGEDRTFEVLEDMLNILDLEFEDDIDLGIKELSSIVLEELQSAAGHSIINLYRKIKNEKGITYREILCNLAENLSIELPKSNRKKLTLAPVKIEKKILEKQFEKIWSKMSLDEKDQFIQDLKDSGKFSKKLLSDLATATGPAAAILLAQSGGFATYSAATATLYAVSSALGLSLSFGVYTTLTQSISVLIGPVGWAIAGTLFAFKAGTPNYKKKILPMVLLISKIRSEVNLK